MLLGQDKNDYMLTTDHVYVSFKAYGDYRNLLETKLIIDSVQQLFDSVYGSRVIVSGYIHKNYIVEFFQSLEENKDG